MIRKIIYLTLAIITLTLNVSAAEHSYDSSALDKGEISKNWNNVIDKLPEEISSEIGDIDIDSAENLTDNIKEKTSLSYWLDYVVSALLSWTDKIFPNLIPIFAMILILSASQTMFPLINNGTTQLFLMFGRLAVAVSLISVTYNVIDIATDYLSNICSIMTTLSPVMQAIYISEGSVTRASISTSALMIVVNAVGVINTKLMAPCANVLFTLSSVAGVCSEVDLRGITSAIRKFIMRLWQIVTIGFSFMLGTQSVIAGSADDLAAKTIKFTLGSVIPMAGGVLAEAYNTVKEGLSFVKSAAGISGIIIILLILIPGIIPLITYKLGLIVCENASEILKLDDISGMLRDVKGIIEIVIAIVLYTSLMFIFAVILFTHSQVG